MIDALQEIGTRLEGERLEPQLRELVRMLTYIEGRRLEAVCARMGLNGPALTLQAAGDIAGITGERIRQLQAGLMDGLKRHHDLYLPAVDTAVSLLERAMPIRVEDAECLLAGEGATRGRLDLSVFVAEWMLALGRRKLKIVEHGETRWIIGPGLGMEEQLASAGFFDAKTDTAIIDSIGRLCRSVGVCSVRWAAEEAGLVLDQETTRGVRRVAKSTGRFSFLGRSWMWDPSVPPGRNRLENTLRKILCVAPDVSLSEVMEALDRVHRQGRLPRLPSLEAVALFASAHPSFDYRNDRVSAAAALDAARELAETEKIFVEVLSTVPGGVLDREALRRACIERGMNGATFGQYTSFSPILAQPGYNLWSLRGRPVDAYVAQRVAATRRRRHRRAEATLTPDGELQVSWTITGPEVSVFTVPSTGRFGYTDRDYHAMRDDGSSAGIVSVDVGGASWGYGRFLREENAVTGDRLVATFDRSRRVVRLTVERAGDRPWVGDLGNCFLQSDSWAIRLYVDHDLLTGGEWTMPLSLADAIGVLKGELAIPWRRYPHWCLTLTRSDGACLGSPLREVLRELGAKRGDRLFLELHTEWFDAQRRPPADPRGDPLQELLASASLPSSLHGEAAWAALSRCLGGSSDGGRDEVEERLRVRGDHVGLGLLDRLKATAVPHHVSWPETWWLTCPLAPDPNRYAVHNEAKAKRVAVGVTTRGAATPNCALVDGRGVVWIDEDRLPNLVRALSGHDGVTLTYNDIAWTAWARAEHHARGAALRNAKWCIQRVDSEWLIGEESHEDLRAALVAVPMGQSGVARVKLLPAFGYPTNAFAFRRAMGDLVRKGLTVIRAGPSGFVAEFESVPPREGSGLIDLVR